MANINVAFGLRPVSKLGQNVNSTGNSGYNFYEIASDNANKIYQGSPVIPLSTGFIDKVGAAAGGTPGAACAARRRRRRRPCPARAPRPAPCGRRTRTTSGSRGARPPSRRRRRRRAAPS